MQIIPAEFTKEDKAIYDNLYTECDCGDPQECSICYGYNKDAQYPRYKYPDKKI